MIILEGDKIEQPIRKAIVTSGTFDGVHFGHQKILKKVTKYAKSAGGHSVVITFWPHPRFVLRPDDHSLKLLSTFQEKADIMEQTGIDYLVKIPFTKQFSQLSSDQFIRQVLIDKIGTNKLIIGYDHKFGKNREGSFEYLKDNAHVFGFEVEEIPRQDIDHVGVSSTKIRTALTEGHVHTASEYLGRAYELSGKVITGQKMGSSIGFPTANIQVNETYKLIPRDGVYAVRVQIDGNIHNGMLNIGVRPTVDGHNRAIEVHIFDFSKDIYGAEITVNFVKRLRDEQKFEGVDQLKGQLKNDRIAAMASLNDEALQR